MGVVGIEIYTVMVKMTFTEAISFDYRGWYCTIQHLISRYRIDIVSLTPQAKTQLFILSLAGKRFVSAAALAEFGEFHTFKVTPWVFPATANREFKKAKELALEYINENLGDAKYYF